MGHDASGPKREIHSITGLFKKHELSQVNILTLHLKELKKRKTMPKVSRRKEYGNK